MTIHIFGGGTILHVRSHLALCAPARGTTARRLAALLQARQVRHQVHLTSMADPASKMETNHDVERRLRNVLDQPGTTGIVFNVALCDFEGQIGDVQSGKYAERLQTRAAGAADGTQMTLRPAAKLLGLVRIIRPDIFSVGFKTTASQSAETQSQRALTLAKEHQLDWVLANDVVSRFNMVFSTLENYERPHLLYGGADRDLALATLADNLAIGVGTRG